MHTSPCSHCAKVPVEQAIKEYALQNVHAVVITNHFNPDFLAYSAKDAAEIYLADYHMAKKTAKELGIRVILGMEIRFEENSNDYLVYGIDEGDIEKAWYYLDKGICEYYTDCKNDKNLILQAHPYRNNMVRVNVNYLDGVEVYNLHPSHNSRVAVAAKEAELMQGIIVGGTDYHYAGDAGLCLTRFTALPSDSYELAALLKNKDYIFQIGGGIVFPYANRK